MSRVVGAIRVSTEAQAERYGPQRQRDAIAAEASRNELNIDEWVEERVSGANHDRAAENRYYELAREYNGDLIVIFAATNRVGRHIEVVVGIARQLHAMGGTVVIAGLGSLREERNWREFLRDAVDAELDHANIVKQAGEGRRAKAKAGLWPHGAVPWGYEIERDRRGKAIRPIITPEAAAVRRVFELSREHGIQVVVKRMREENWPAPTSRGWSIKTVANIVVNSLYTGVRVFQGITITYDAIITPAEFNEVQRQREKRRNKGRNSKVAPLLFTGHARCTCGAAIGRDVDASKYKGKVYAEYIIYRCWKAKRRTILPVGTVQADHAPQIRVDEFNAKYWGELVKMLTTPELLAEIVAPIPPEPLPTARIDELQAAIARAYEPLTAGALGYTLEIAERLAAPYAKELEVIQRTPRHSPDQINDAELKKLASDFANALKSGNITHEEKRDLLNLLDVQITIGKNGVLESVKIELP